MHLSGVHCTCVELVIKYLYAWDHSSTPLCYLRFCPPLSYSTRLFACIKGFDVKSTFQTGPYQRVSQSSQVFFLSFEINQQICLENNKIFQVAGSLDCFYDIMWTEMLSAWVVCVVAGYHRAANRIEGSKETEKAGSWLVAFYMTLVD